MLPLRKLRESGKPTPAEVRELLADNIVFNNRRTSEFLHRHLM
jgi:hypothetical protein